MEITPPDTDLALNCGLCWRSYPVSQMGLRGKLNFCQSCATERSAECLARLQGLEKKSRWPAVVLSVVALGCIGGAVWAAVKLMPAHASSGSTSLAAPPRMEEAPVMPSIVAAIPA